MTAASPGTSSATETISRRRTQRVGDRDVRSEDRQLLLDALLAAREHLVITYTGRDERSNLPRPPAVPVGELLDVVDRTVQIDDGPASQAVIVEHPLQPFDRQELRAGPARVRRTLEFRRVAPGWSPRRTRAAARRAPSSWSVALPDAVGDEARWSSSTTLTASYDIRSARSSASGSASRCGTEPVTSKTPSRSSWTGWQSGRSASASSRARLGGDDWATCEAAEKARGALPPSSLADPLLNEMAHSIEALVAASRGRAASRRRRCRRAGRPGGHVRGASAPCRVCVATSSIPSPTGGCSPRCAWSRGYACSP